MRDLNALALPDLFRHLTADGSLDRLLSAAREEDLGATGDVTTRSIVPSGARMIADIAARAPGIVAGMAAIPRLLEAFKADVACSRTIPDGARCAAGQTLGRLEGSRADMLALERTLLNLVGRLSGIATSASQFVATIRGTGAVVCDTRKTTPGMRSLEKYAVRCGGATLHRMGLFDAVLYKDNHLAGIPLERLADEVARAIRAARGSTPLRFVEVEVDSLEQLDCLLGCEARLIDIILLDNMDLSTLREAVRRRDLASGRVQLEASGGVNLETVRAIAETGVDRISVGSITHSAPVLDIGLDIRVSPL